MEHETNVVKQYQDLLVKQNGQFVMASFNIIFLLGLFYTVSLAMKSFQAS